MSSSKKRQNASVLPASAISTDSPSSTLPSSSRTETQKGTNIGIIVGVVIVAILTIIAISFCVFDFRQRYVRWRSKGRGETRHVSQLEARPEVRGVWEGVMGRRANRRRIEDEEMRPGVWDRVRIERTERVGGTTERPHDIPVVPETTEGSSRSAHLRERQSNMGHRRTCQDKDMLEVKVASLAELEEIYLPPKRDKESSAVFPTVASSGAPLMSVTVVTRCLLDGRDGNRRR